MSARSDSDDTRSRVHVVISGKVQGVFFRANVRDLALKLNVNGWIKNLPNGRVEAMFEGKNDDVEKMINFCKTGPLGAKVDDIEVKREDYRGEFSGFTIRF